MRDYFLLSAVCLCASALVGMAGPPINKASGYRVVFEFDSQEPRQQEALLNNVDNLLNTLGPRTEIIVVVHGDGLSLLYRPESAIANRVTELAGKGVSFAACANTLRIRQVAKEALLPVAVTVDSGVAEVVRKQADGWSYLKAGR